MPKPETYISRDAETGVPVTPRRDATASGPWYAFGGAIVLCCVADAYLPHAAGTALTWLVILGFSYGMAAWNRRQAGWVALWVMCGLCVIGVSLQIAGLMGAGLSSAGFFIAAPVLAVYWWLIRMGRAREAEPAVPQEVHHFHHVITHPATETAATVPAKREPVSGSTRPVIAGRVVPAIAPPHKLAGSLFTAAREAATERKHR